METAKMVTGFTDSIDRSLAVAPQVRRSSCTPLAELGPEGAVSTVYTYSETGLASRESRISCRGASAGRLTSAATIRRSCTACKGALCGYDLLGIDLHLDHDAKERRHHLFPSLIPVIHRTIRIGVKLVVGRVVKVGLDRHHHDAWVN